MKEICDVYEMKEYICAYIFYVHIDDHLNKMFYVSLKSKCAKNIAIVLV